MRLGAPGCHIEPTLSSEFVHSPFLRNQRRPALFMKEPDMAATDAKPGFSGGMPALYQQYLVPLIFEAYARDLAERVVPLRPQRLLEVAAGTGAVTRCLAQVLPQECEIVASDISQPMLDHAAGLAMARPVQWQQADAMQLPFAVHRFDVAVCQFGVMFFPDKARALAEIRRVVRPGGHLLFNVWDGIEHNEFAFVIEEAVAGLFPDDPPRFLSTTPHGYHDAVAIASDLQRAGFLQAPDVATLTTYSQAASARIPAAAYCQGTPLRTQIEARDPSKLEEATDVAEAALIRRFGNGVIKGKIQALVVDIEV
jgi:SAM-dependent methyltransferase